MAVNVVSKTALERFARAHPPAAGPLQTWHTVVSHATWTCVPDVRKTYNTVDHIGGETLVFNVNSNRIIANVAFNSEAKTWLYIQHVFTHSEYDAWNKAR